MAEGDINLKLATAAENGDSEEVQKCLKKGADPNKSDALRYAAWKGHKDIVQLLLIHGADPNRIGALTEAAWGGYIDIVRLLLSHGADLNESDALGYATWGGHTDIVELLLGNGADPNKYDTLEDAASTGRTNIVKLLLAYGANPKESNALEEAAKWGHGDIVFLLLEHGDDPEKLTSTDGKTDFSEAVQEAISKNQERLQQEYAEAISDSVETNCNITIAVVGHRGVGKTCLVKQLLKEAIPREGPGATDTSDLHVEYIAINPETGLRKKLEENGEIMTCSQRLKRITSEYRKGKRAEASMLEKEADSKNKDVAASASTHASEVEIAESSASRTKPEAKHYKKELPKEQKQFIRQIMQQTSKEGSDEVKGFVKILDFGGDSVSNDMHQSFLNSNMVFALVIDVNTCLDPERSKTEYEAIEYWLTHIAKYALEDATLDRRTPAVIIIGSNIDQVSSDTKEQSKQFAEVLAKLRENQQLQEIMELHVQEIFAIANLNDSTANQDVDEAVWQRVMEIAPLQSQWGKAIPSKWIALELELIRLKNNGHILLTYDDLLEVNNNLPVPLSDTEILQFLGYMKLTGTFLCFHPYTGHPFIVLQSMWVIDGFNRIVSDQNIKGILSDEMSLQREEYEKSGVLTMELLTALWDDDRFKGHFKTLCTVMESLNILVKPITDDPNVDVGFFIVPCLLPTSNPEPIRSVLANTVTTITLCTTFDKSVIPRYIWDTLIASCIHRFEKLHESGYDELKLIQRGFACLTFNATWNMVINCKGNVMKVTMFSTDTQSSTAGAGVQLQCILENLLQRTLEKNHQGHLKYQFYLHNDFRFTSTDRMVKVDDLTSSERLQCFGPEGSQWINNEDSYVWFKDPASESKSLQNIEADDASQKEAALFETRRESELLQNTVQVGEAVRTLTSHKRDSMSDRLPTLSEDLDFSTEIDAVVIQEDKEKEAAAVEISILKSLETIGTDDVTEYGQKTAEKRGEQEYDTETPAEEKKLDHIGERKQSDAESSEEEGEQVHDEEGKQKHDTESSEEGWEQGHDIETPAEKKKQDHREERKESSSEGEEEQAHKTEIRQPDVQKDGKTAGTDVMSSEQPPTLSEHHVISTDIKSIVDIVKKGNIKEFEILEKKTQTEEASIIPIVTAALGSLEMIEFIAKQPNTKWDSELNIREYASAMDLPGVWEDMVTPLYIAVSLDRTHVVRSLLKYSSNENIKKCFWKSPLLTEPMKQIFTEEVEKKLEEKHSELHPIIIPGHRAEDEKEKKNPCHIVYSEHVNWISYERDLLGFEVEIRNPYVFSEKCNIKRNRKTITNTTKTLSDEDIKKAKKALSLHQTTLWEQHSNLNIITVSPVKRRRNGQDDIEKPCIALYCSTKDFIPKGDPLFPQRLTTGDGDFIDVDVLEGYFISNGYNSLPSNNFHDKLKMGCDIGKITPEYDTKGKLLPPLGGTLGPFVRFNNKIGFLTCAHVLFNLPNGYIDFRADEANKAEIVQPSPDSNIAFTAGPCGHVHRAIFNPKLNPSIDVAVVELTESARIPDKGQFANAKKSTYIKAGFSELPEYNSGSIERDPRRLVNKGENAEVYKFGSTTDVTKGTLAETDISVRTPHTLQLPNDGKRVTVQNQFQVIGSGPTWRFLDLGDSGAPVFIKSDTGELVLIGIGIGHAYLGAYPVAVVTPIGDIMDALGDEYSIASFQ